MQAFTTLLAVLALAHSALAGVYTTSPVATTSGTGGQVLTVSWGELLPSFPMEHKLTL